MSELTKWLRDNAEQAEGDECPDEAKRLREAAAEIERLQTLLTSRGLCQACLGNPMVQTCEPWCKEAQLLRKAEAARKNPS